MPLNENHPNSVMFVCVPDTDGTRQPIGTASMVGFSTPSGGYWRYFVTAHHVVRDEPETFIRLRRADGGEPVDERIDRWIPHPTCDVAVTPCDFDTRGLWAMFLEDKFFSDRWAYGAIRLGESVVFMGLLQHVGTMVDRNVPMFRTGTIGALFAEDIPVRDKQPGRAEYTRMEPFAHLIDCYSRSGFSGSPVYLDHPVVDVHPGIALSVGSKVALLGVLVGHFGSPGDNAGVAVVVPVEAVRELIETNDELAVWREGKERAMREDKRKQREGDSAELDSTHEASEYQRFEDLTRQLIKTPKIRNDETEPTKDERSH